MVDEGQEMKRSGRISPGARKYFFLFCVLVLLLPLQAQAQRKGRLAGKVIDFLDGRPVAGALVTIQGTTLSTLTDKNGKFSFDLPEGKVGISIHKAGYLTTNYQDIVITAGKITTYKCECVLGDEKENIFFSIGGITVLERKDLIPDKIETTHEISSAEIEHQLSTNLGDILDIVPGIERTKAPGLSAKTQVELRGSGAVQDAETARFGTKIMIDDITISNNANLQSGTGTSYGATGTTAGSGIDLRTIPADNIENVEVVTGIPSAEYGDLTTGLVKVKTKKGRQPHRLKIKSNPDTKEGNFSGGILWKRTGLSYNANYAYSERDIRRDGDEYSRYSGQLTARNDFLGDRLSMMNKFYYTGTHDEQNLDVDDPLSIETYNRDKTFIFGNSIDFKPTSDTKLEWTGSINYTKRNSYQQKLVGADTRVLTDAMEEGTFPGFFDAGAYLSRIWTNGKEYNVSGKLNFRYDFGTGAYDHSMLAGSEYNFDDNVGDGKTFNILKPPYGNLGQRPLSFDAVPGLSTASVYFEDEVSGSLRMRPWSLNLGFRYEMYNPEKLDLAALFNEDGVVKSKNGTFFNPRVRFKYELAADTQVRFGWGKSSKMPMMTRIFQGPEYIDIVEENVTPPDSIPLVRTYILNIDTSRLMGDQNEKTELSLDQKIGPVGVTLTGYYSHSKDIPRSQRLPLTVYRYRWENYPDPSSATPIDTIITETDSDVFNNVGWYKNYGVEFEVRTKRIEKISTQFKVTGSYYETNSGADGVYMSSARFNTVLGRTIFPYYYYTDNWRRKMIVNYTADWMIKRLGMWVTFFLQNTLFDADILYKDPVLYATAYFDPLTKDTVSLTPDESAAYELDRTYEDIYLAKQKKPNDRFLFNINVSKSIGRSAELSLFVHNFFDDAAYYLNERGTWEARNHDIFYGVEFSMILDDLWNRFRTGEE